MPKLVLAVGENYELCPGYTLRRATSEEIDQIHEFVGNSRCFGETLRAYFERKLEVKDEKRLLIEQPRESWKYSVVQFDGKGEDLVKLEYALDLLPLGLVLAITLLDSGGSVVNLRNLGHSTLQSVLSWSSSGIELNFPAVWLPIIRSAYVALKPLDRTNPLVKPFRQFHLLKHLPMDSDAHVLGLFSVIEMMLTHKPSEKLHDSLRHQVSVKMALLSKRFLKNDLYALFPDQDRADLWKALYDWRSLIAHGDEVDFAKGSLRKLESEEKAHAFLDLNVRLLLKTWLDEHDLLSDLKRC